jgi:tRNA nucleotidyltransferase (CCA-adding enzyme)
LKIIAPHRNPDFDAFASAVAYKVLHPDHIIVLSGHPTQNLHEYLRIYGDRFEYIREKELEESPVEKVVIVDAASPNRLGKKIRELLKLTSKVVVYDHHPGIKESGIEGELHIEKVGAATTILVEEIMKAGMDIDPITATLLAIAIYEDTGNLLYSSTTPRDLEAVKFLLESGANLVEVSEYVKLDLSYDQKQILEELIKNVKEYVVNGVEVAVSTAEYDKFVGGLNVVTSKLWNSGGYETLICVIKMGKKIFMIGRTSSPDVDIGGLMSDLGGGGHRKAGSTTLENMDIDSAVSLILGKLKDHISPALRARDVMSSPVKVIYAHSKIEEANRIMEITGHNGLPVVEGNKLVGIVTKKAVDKAMNHGLGDRPVKSIMSTKLVTATPDTPLSKIRQLMIEHDIGRIPILENGILVGIVTRTDILREIFGEVTGKKRVEGVYRKDSPNFFDVRKLIEERIRPNVHNLLRLLGTLGEEIEMKVYVVGGFVRDLLLGIPNEDVDIVVEGDGTRFAEYVSKFLKVKVVIHEQFMTASLFFKDGFRVDIATARTEYYESPAKLPQVDISTIKKDLYRRDFTINAMAIKLNPSEFGVLYDFFGGRKDLEEGIIRALHTLSFIDDPTRILRAVRFEQRFDFKIEEVTEKLMREAVEGGYLEKVTGMRLRQEIEKILEEKNPLKSIRRLAQFNVIKHLFPRTFYTQVMDEKLENLFSFIPFAKKYFKNLNVFYALMYVFLEYYDEGNLEFVKFRYSIPDRVTNELKTLEKRVGAIADGVKRKEKFSWIYENLKNVSPEGICYIAAYLPKEGRKRLEEYLKKLEISKPVKINGKALMKMGVKPGPEMGRIIDEVIKAKLDDLITTEDEEIKFVENLLKIRRDESERTSVQNEKRVASEKQK